VSTPGAHLRQSPIHCASCHAAEIEAPEAMSPSKADAPTMRHPGDTAVPVAVVEGRLSPTELSDHRHYLANRLRIASVFEGPQLEFSGKFERNYRRPAVCQRFCCFGLLA
jgi:hypothetical protein